MEVRGWGVAQWHSTCLTVETLPGFHPQKIRLHKILPVSLTYLPEGEFYIIRMVGTAEAGKLNNR